MSTPPASKRRNMALLVGALVLTLSVWFAGTAAGPALLRRFSAGAAMAGVYPVCMKLAASWAKGDLGLLIGLVVGAVTPSAG
jgi:hypothetical protein